MKYRLYVDDSGNREYDKDLNYTTSGRERHFVYGAILLTEANESRLIARFRDLKKATFGRPDIEIKSNWLRIPAERKKRYLDPFGLSDTQLSDFSNACYELIREHELELIAVAVDKLHMQETYAPPRQPWQAPTAAYEFLMQRVVQAVPKDSTVEVVVDDIGGKNDKDKEYRDMLADHHEKLRKSGSSLQSKLSFACLSGPVRFRASEHTDLIQLADLVAYCIFRQFREYPDAWEADTPKLTTYPYLGRIFRKFRCGPGNRVQGFGIVKVPMLRRIHWVWTDKDKKK